jgi:predicted nuclease of predicted toxin-antitoxin system
MWQYATQRGSVVVSKDEDFLYLASRAGMSTRKFRARRRSVADGHVVGLTRDQVSYRAKSKPSAKSWGLVF